MGYEPVDVLVRGDEPARPPLAGVVVRIFSADGSYVYGQWETGPDGRVGALLPAPATYEVRFYKFGVSFRPLLLDVREAPEKNAFEALGAVFVHGQSADRRLCVASGFFRRADGSPAPSVDLRFTPTFNPLLVEGAAMLNEPVSTRTDKAGFGSLSLVRFGIYRVLVQGSEDRERRVEVPDAPWVNLGDLIYPVVEAIYFDVEPPFLLSPGQSLVLRPRVVASDRRELPVASDVFWSVEGDSVALEIGRDTLTLRAVGRGTSVLKAARRDASIVRIPATPIAGVPASCVVSP